MTFKPMLASHIKDVQSLRYPVLVSPKLDGIRATRQNGIFLSRSLKPIPNRRVQEAFQSLPNFVDGELIYGAPTAKDVFRQTTHAVMSKSGMAATGVLYYAFDFFSHEGFQERYARLQDVLSTQEVAALPIKLVKQIRINNASTLLDYEEETVERGYEGIMVRGLDAPYKQGRSSLNEGYLLKLKRFLDAEAIILDVLELQRNGNPAMTNNLGRTERSTAQAGLIPGDTMGKLVVRDMETKVEFEVGTGFDDASRAGFWANRNRMKGLVIKYKYFPVGVKDKPRHPVYIGIRDERDMS